MDIIDKLTSYDLHWRNSTRGEAIAEITNLRALCAALIATKDELQRRLDDYKSTCAELQDMWEHARRDGEGSSLVRGFTITAPATNAWGGGGGNTPKPSRDCSDCQHASALPGELLPRHNCVFMDSHPNWTPK